MAAGIYYNGLFDQALTESWDGTSWNLTTTPEKGSAANYLSGISCSSSSHCVAAGNYYDGSHEQTLVETWNGTSWYSRDPERGQLGQRPLRPLVRDVDELRGGRILDREHRVRTRTNPGSLFEEWLVVDYGEPQPRRQRRCERATAGLLYC